MFITDKKYWRTIILNRFKSRWFNISFFQIWLKNKNKICNFRSSRKRSTGYFLKERNIVLVLQWIASLKDKLNLSFPSHMHSLWNTLKLVLVLFACEILIRFLSLCIQTDSNYRHFVWLKCTIKKLFFMQLLFNHSFACITYNGIFHIINKILFLLLVLYRRSFSTHIIFLFRINCFHSFAGLL
jgi:hypothetical protein